MGCLLASCFQSRKILALITGLPAPSPRELTSKSVRTASTQNELVLRLAGSVLERAVRGPNSLSKAARPAGRQADQVLGSFHYLGTTASFCWRSARNAVSAAATLTGAAAHMDVVAGFAFQLHTRFDRRLTHICRIKDAPWHRSAIAKLSHHLHHPLQSISTWSPDCLATRS